MKLNIDLIKQRLFEKALDKIARDFNLDMATIHTPDDFIAQILGRLNQVSVENPKLICRTNDEVFEAALEAICSNMRQWSKVQTNKDEIHKLIRKYSLYNIGRDEISSSLSRELGGLTATKDANRILLWHDKLKYCEGRNYYQHINSIADKIQLQAFTKSIELTADELFVCVICHFVGEGEWPGMGFALGSEFLRNLGWNGFKPDRHVKRLIFRWVNGRISVGEKLDRIRKTLGDSDDIPYSEIIASLLAIEICPRESKLTFSQIDNLVWLLGSYVERKGCESGYNYMLG